MKLTQIIHQQLTKTIVGAVVFICLLGAMPTQTVAQTDLFGTMLGLQSSIGFSGQTKLENYINESWLTLRDHETYSDFLNTYEKVAVNNGQLIKQTGFSSNRDVVGAFTWNVIVPRPGEYDWSITDATVTAAGNAGVTLSAVIHPYSRWGSKQQLPDADCDSIDFAYFDRYTGSPKRWNAYKKFLSKLVERYDGDGQADMPGLINKIPAWEIANEVEGSCSGDLDNPTRYLKLLRTSYTEIKAADPSAIVTNGGALEIIGNNGARITKTRNFWNDFFDSNGQEYLDVFNLHYNLERDGAHDTMAEWNTHLRFFSRHLAKSDIPIWVTEFGTFAGTNADSGKKQTERFQAAWYLRYVITGMASGVERYYIDLKGQTGSPVTGGALYTEGAEPRLFLTTLQTVAAQLEGYTAVTKLATGQYKFTVDEQTVYALWSGTLPQKLTSAATVTTYKLNGAAVVQSGAAVDYSETAPVLVVVAN